MRVELRAEQALKRYKPTGNDDITSKTLLFMWELCNWKPNGPHQIFWIDALRKVKNAVLKAPPRSGKTTAFEVVDLNDLAMNPMEDLCVYAPKLSQCKELLAYHYDWIDKSPLLTAYLRRRNGKKILSSETYEFVNGSTAKCFSIMGNMESVNVSIARIEEFDDWQWEKFANELPRRLGAASKNEMGKRLRLTGTIMGEENFFKLENDPDLKRKFEDLSISPTMGKIDIHLLLALGTVMDYDAVMLQKSLMSADEWARSMLLYYTEAKNFIRQKYIRAGQKRSLEWGLEPVVYVPGGRYERMAGAKVSCGLDCGHAGTKEDSSQYSLQFEEAIQAGNVTYKRWLNGMSWDPTTDTTTLIKDICDWISFYKPDGGYGDALGMHIISAVNAELYRRGVTDINIADFPENVPGNWHKWFLIPMWNNDVPKHDMYTGLQVGIQNMTTYFPYFDGKDDRHEAVMCKNLIRQVQGIKQKKNKNKVPSYYAESKKIGDDDADAFGMADKWLNDHDPGYINWGQVKMQTESRVFNNRSILASLNGDND